MNNNSTWYVGLDVHKESITVAYAINSEPVELMGKIGTTPTDIERLCKRLQSKSSQVNIVYEACPCGYGAMFAKSVGVDVMQSVTRFSHQQSWFQTTFSGPDNSPDTPFPRRETVSSIFLTG